MVFSELKVGDYFKGLNNNDVYMKLGVLEVTDDYNARNVTKNYFCKFQLNSEIIKISKTS